MCVLSVQCATEAIESGSIPILVQDAEYAAHPCKDAFKPILDSGAPVVVMGDWSELEETLTRLLPTVNAMQERLLQWRQKFWTKVARQVDCAILGRHSRDTGHSYDRLASCSDLEDDVHASPATTKAASPTLSQSDVLAMTPLTLPVVGSQNSIPLITGCGRSGTLSLMEYLRSINVQAVHEQVATAHVSVSWLYAAESDVYPFELKNSLVLRKKLKASLPPGKPLFGPVVHLTRHPLKVMSSTRRCFCGKGDRTLARGAKNDKRSWVFAERFLPRMRADLPYESLERSAVYWLEWNKMIEENFPERTHVRLEDVDPGVLVRSLGLTSIDTSSLPRTMPRAKFHTSPDKEKVKLPDVTWTELYNMDPDMTREVFELARHYGYELDTTLEDNLAQGK
ncbi:Hypothetical Protein FCC1311_070842 [Hondaea fermentalgiana]|uniref:Uncharacterized protein n=1 Tax=Hondaea fermentalgiana TaxID=2315210 RepID=A0A2R5GSK7_9STRA|nr:Hypothetical Protein FCC1311_070842 [Hondaea fermentalgiana]|eukprot:GBG30864.1 Hypothetical Protein FCC1311_070842 [Hondaea fermentalgiana]